MNDYLPKMNCRNCEIEFQPNDHYCRNCGQKLALAEEFKISRVLSQFFGNIFSFDSKVFKTLSVLFTPGKYYILFRDGKRARYMHPLRLFIFLNIFLFGLIVSYNGSVFEEGNSKESLFTELVWGNDTIPPDTLKLYSAEELLVQYPQEGFMDVLAFKQIVHLYQDQNSFLTSVIEKLPWLFFLFIPFMALCSFVLERKHKALYLQHFLFWANIVSACILAISFERMIYILIEEPIEFIASLILFCPIFSFWSLQRIFPTKGFFRKIVKWLLYIILGTCILTASMITVLALGFFMF